MATKANWLKQATDELNKLQRSIDFVSAISATKPKSIVLIKLGWSKEHRYLVEPIAFNHLSIRSTILATTNKDWGTWGIGTFNYDAIESWELVPETDLPLYIGWPYVGPALAQRLHK